MDQQIAPPAPTRILRGLRWGLLVVAIAAVAGLAGGQLGLFSGSRPLTLGLAAGKLSPCKPTPNCVSSQADAADAGHYVAPLAFSGDPAVAWSALRQALRGMERATIVRDEPGYLHAEFTSRLLGFVDDAEFAPDPSGLIHVRSASRLGRSDFGVNRARVEAIRVRMKAPGRS